MIIHPRYLPDVPRVDAAIIGNPDGLTSTVAYFHNGRFVRATEMPEQDVANQNHNAAMDCAETVNFLRGEEE